MGDIVMYNENRCHIIFVFTIVVCAHGVPPVHELQDEDDTCPPGPYTLVGDKYCCPPGMKTLPT